MFQFTEIGVGMGFEQLISEVTESAINYPVPHKTFGMLVSISYHLSIKYNGMYYTGSNQTTGIYWPHITTLFYNKAYHVTSDIQDFVKCCIKDWCTLTFDMTCYLVDYNPYFPTSSNVFF